jgi:hypothetical protein
VKNLLLHSYEDSWLRHAFSARLEADHDVWLGPSRRRISVIVLRDPFNLFASRRRAGRSMAPHIERRMWKQHARVALNQTGQGLRGEVCVIRYNDWACDPAYRAAVAHRLGLSFTDAGADRVPATCGGSSFDGMRFDGSAAAMETQDRWRHYINDPGYCALFDPELIALSAQLFGPPPTEVAQVERLEDV